jgi:hypothetical protein
VLECGPDTATWRCDDRWVTLQSGGTHVLALACGGPGGLRQLEPRPADTETVTKLAWDAARHLAI